VILLTGILLTFDFYSYFSRN